MPNRIIKESLCASEKIAQLSDFEFRLWIGLITQADDAGRGDARPAIIKGRVFPFRDRITLKDIDTAIHALAAHSCVCLYEVDGKPYYVFPSWGKHQRIRDVKPKYPPPNGAVSDSLPQSAANCGELRPEYNTIQSNPNTESEYEYEYELEHAPAKKKKTTSVKNKHPTLEEVREYAKSRNSAVDPDRFYDYFNEGNWIDSKGNPVKSWKQKFITWESNTGGTKTRGRAAGAKAKTSEEYKGKDFWDD